MSDGILRSAMASKLAYAKNAAALKTFPIVKQLHPTRDPIHIIESVKTGAHAYVCETGTNSKYISFRGSHTFKDIIKCINTHQTSFHFADHQVKIHNYIYLMFESIEPILTNEILKTTSSKSQNITFCGHSLGGSIATLAATYYATLTDNRFNIDLHTFGAPKVGNAAFTEWHAQVVKNPIHIKNKCDIVPNFPFCTDYSSTNHYVMDYTSHNILEDHDLDTYIDHIMNAIEITSRRHVS